MLKKIIALLFITLSVHTVQSQELQAKVSVLAQQIGTTVNPKIFTTLQSQLTDLINNRRWSKATFLPQEKIQCSFFKS